MLRRRLRPGQGARARSRRRQEPRTPRQDKPRHGRVRHMRATSGENSEAGAPNGDGRARPPLRSDGRAELGNVPVKGDDTAGEKEKKPAEAARWRHSPAVAAPR